jgi:TRAP-type mannitol/chloroaromatic compound transport system substrate-binding protein
VQISVFPPEVIETMCAAAEEHYRGNAAFAKIYASQKDFRDRNYLYHRAADYQYDTTLLTLRRKP